MIMRTIGYSLRQFFCRHDFRIEACHKHVSENLYQCTKCSVYFVWHWGLGLGFKSKSCPGEDWLFYEVIGIGNRLER